MMVVIIIIAVLLLIVLVGIWCFVGLWLLLVVVDETSLVIRHVVASLTLLLANWLVSTLSHLLLLTLGLRLQFSLFVLFLFELQFIPAIVAPSLLSLISSRLLVLSELSCSVHRGWRLLSLLVRLLSLLLLGCLVVALLELLLIVGLLVLGLVVVVARLLFVWVVLLIIGLRLNSLLLI